MFKARGRDVFGMAMALTVATAFFSGTVHAADGDAASADTPGVALNDKDRAMIDTLTGARLVGSFTSVGGAQPDKLNKESYTIVSVTKLRDNVVTHCAFKSVNPFVLAFTTGTGTIENNQIDNCIFYQDNSYSPWYALLDNVYPSDLHFLNNFYGKPASASNTDYFWVNGSTLTSLPAFRAAGQETLSGTSYGLSGDSLFQSGSEEDGFKLHAGSPARNASVSFPPAVPGSIDYFRNSAPVGTRDIGAHDVQ